MSGKALGALAGILLALAGLAGCGSDSLSLRDLRTRASGVCTAADRSAGRIPSPASPSSTGQFLRAGIRNLDQELTGLRSAVPPSGSAADYGQATASLTKIVGALRVADRDLRAGGDPVFVVRELQRRVDPLRQSADDAWRKLGVADCLSS